jgi:hypothetical protein
MKPREVSVSVADFGGELYVNITLRLPGHSLEREAAHPDPVNADRTKVGTRVRESARKAKSKELRKLIEGVEFPDA